jgi:hypothetical protein
MFYLTLYALGAVLGVLLSQYAPRKIDKAALKLLGFMGLLLPYLVANLISGAIGMFCGFVLSFFISGDEDGTDEPNQ